MKATNTVRASLDRNGQQTISIFLSLGPCLLLWCNYRMRQKTSNQENELNKWRGWWNESGRKMREENENLREKLDGLKDGRVLDVARYEREAEEAKADIKKLLEWIEEQRLRGVWKEDMMERKTAASVN